MAFWFDHIGQIWWASLSRETVRYAIFAVATWALLWIVLKGPLRARKIREHSPAAGQLLVEFIVSLRSIAIFATVALAQSYMSRAGAYPLTHVALQWGPAWLWASLLLMILGHDAYFYWTHRAMHDPRLFKAFHGRHHRSHNPSPFTAYSFDLSEAAVMASFVILWPFIVPTPWEVIPLFILHQIVRNTLAHCGYELMPATSGGRPLLDWLTTTTHHDLHHAQSDSNFGLYFTWWDRWMKTENPDFDTAFARSAFRRAVATDVFASAPTISVQRGSTRAALRRGGVVFNWSRRLKAAALRPMLSALRDARSGAMSAIGPFCLQCFGAGFLFMAGGAFALTIVLT
jgi:sterol desaturase/sphingolipid hydroxylase (fatty acid hydroxylase superfamily)